MAEYDIKNIIIKNTRFLNNESESQIFIFDTNIGTLQNISIINCSFSNNYGIM